MEILNKKVKAMLFIFLILFCISAVNAETIDNNSEVDSVDINIKSATMPVATTTDADGSFTDLNNEVNRAVNGEITLEKNYTYEEETDGEFKNGINITQSISINGDGHTIDGKNIARIFFVTNGFLTLKNINLINGNASDGGAIYSYYNVNIVNSTFSNNNAAYGGGAIFTVRGLVNVTDSSFTNNNAKNGSGGAIHSGDGVKAVNSLFENNTAKNGGAIFSIARGVNATNSNFTGNNATAKGGAIYTNIGVNNESCIFTDNKVNGKENNIYISKSKDSENKEDESTSPEITDSNENNDPDENIQDEEVEDSTAGDETPDITVTPEVPETDVDAETPEDETVEIPEADETPSVPEDVEVTEPKRDEVQNIDPILKVENLSKNYGENKKLDITLKDSVNNALANKEVKVTINGQTYTRTTDENGNILMNINLNTGVYKTTVSYGNITKEVTVTIVSTIDGKDVVKYFRNGTQYYAKFYDVDGKALANKEVTFNINGVFYTRTTDAYGVAKLTINLNAGKYIITAYNSANGQSFSNNIEVLKTIESKNIQMTTANRQAFKVTVMNGEGKVAANQEVVFNINGVFYFRTTDANGVASLNINLIAGEYVITTISNDFTVANTVSIM